MWHRYYTWLFERALKDECGYTRTQPVGLDAYVFTNIPTTEHY